MDRSWALKALGAWIGTVTGIVLCFASGYSDFASRHGWSESFGQIAGWSLAMGSPLGLLIALKTKWDTPR